MTLAKSRTPTVQDLKIGIIGGAGYTGGELLRLLLQHPAARIDFVHSRSNAGNSLAHVHPDLLGCTDMNFTAAINNDIDCLFLCRGHGQSAAFIRENSLPGSFKLIDLSQDFRIRTPAQPEFCYGLPERNREAIRKARRIANPGCFATAIQLALLPLADAHLLKHDLHVNAITGSTGAGQTPGAATHFSWRSHNISVYKAFTHQHLPEIYQTIREMQPDFSRKINFIPYRGSFTRGILAAVYLQSSLSQDEAHSLYEDYYAAHPFVYISARNPALKQVINTNHAVLYMEKHDDTLMIISIIDNLLKGAVGQAVQNMNLMFDVEETSGLRLKAVAF